MSKTSSNQLSNRSFGLIFAAIFLFIALLPIVSGDAYRTWALIISTVFFLSASLAPRTLTHLNHLWTKFGQLMHKVVNPILMALIFFCTVLPTGFFLRIFGKDPMQRHLNPKTISYWQTRETEVTKNSFDNQF